ncbi:MAG: (2Fe-2S)-binding protein [Pseudomonadota bacterium]
MEDMKISFVINGHPMSLSVPPQRTLLEMIREDLLLTGTKEGCGHGECGTCTVILDGKTVNSCLVLAVEAQGKEITTVEGLAQGDQLHPLQQAFVEHHGMQCGFCTSGMLIAAKSLLDHNPDPTREQIKEGLAGNLCRCTGYIKIFDAVEAAAGSLKKEQAS